LATTPSGDDIAGDALAAPASLPFLPAPEPPRMRSSAVAAILIALAAAPAAPAAAQSPELLAREVKWVRDSEEYATLARQTYRMAARAVTAAVRDLPRGRGWAVVLDVDETALDNTAYELERRAYRVPHDEAVFAAWIARREAAVVPGAAEFVAEVRRLGGRVAWITNRLEPTREDTRANLALRDLWRDGDRLCLATGDTAYTKGARRIELTRGAGACAWTGEPVTIVAFVGDALGDFPRAGETDPDAGNDAAFGARFFLLPNPMYGSWERRVTRARRH
jgi:5'-nucleotidase (lipoprotein e(P4) family)